MCDYAKFFDSYRRYRFEPDGLPDSGGAVVIDAFRQTRVRLFTARLLRALSILDAKSQTVFARLQIRRDIELEWNVTTAIVTDFLTVDPDGAGVVDGAEVKQQVSFVELFRKLE